MEIIPAIIAKSFDELQEKIKRVEPYVKSVQIDVMDGIFAPNKTWPHNNCHPELVSGSMKILKQMENGFSASKQHDSGLDIEVHLMVEDAEGEVEKWFNSGVKRILVHYEAVAKLTVNSKQLTIEEIINNLKEQCQQCGCELGIVFNLETPINIIDNFLSVNCYLFSVVQLMSIAQIGYHGQPFDERVIPKIRALRERYPDVKIQVDGGINLENASQIIEAGADILVIGSTIFNSENIGETIRKIKES